MTLIEIVEKIGSQREFFYSPVTKVLVEWQGGKVTTNEGYLPNLCQVSKKSGLVYIKPPKLERTWLYIPWTGIKGFFPELPTGRHSVPPPWLGTAFLGPLNSRRPTTVAVLGWLEPQSRSGSLGRTGLGEFPAWRSRKSSTLYPDIHTIHIDLLTFPAKVTRRRGEVWVGVAYCSLV